MGEDACSDDNQYLAFRLGADTYAVGIGKVREVLDFTSVTHVPRTPDFMRGVINLRGNVVPVVDMRIKFGLEQSAKTVDTCIIIVDIEIDGERTIVGALVDSVQEVLEIEAAHIEPPPRIGRYLRTDFIRGMGRVAERFVILLDIDRVFCADDIESIRPPEEAIV